MVLSWRLLIKSDRFYNSQMSPGQYRELYGRQRELIKS